MSSEVPKWSDVAEKLRRAMGLCPPTPTEANHAISTAKELPMSQDEILDIVRAATQGEAQKASFHSDHSWTEEFDTKAVADDMLVMNRNPGEDDEEVDKKVDELRREALDEDEPSDEQA